MLIGGLVALKVLSVQLVRELGSLCEFFMDASKLFPKLEGLVILSLYKVLIDDIYLFVERVT